MSIQITPPTRDLYILDLDGCIINSDERLPLLFKEDGTVKESRQAYDEAHHTDKTIPAGHEMYAFIVASKNHLFVTGRGEDARGYTTDQLEKIFGHPIDQARLLMRPHGCENEHDTVLKPRLIEEAGYSLDRILLVIEDRNSTVQMWRDRGITCWQTQLGNF